MAVVDLAIVLVMLVAVLGGLAQGFFRSVFALAGLLLGLALGAWNYGRIAALLMPLVRIRPVANAIGFIAIALLVMALFGVAGKLLSKLFHQMGLGCLDRLAGAVFGFFQGAVLVTLGIVVAVAFFPRAEWLREGKLPPLFFGACHLSMHISPQELAERVRHGLDALEAESPHWMHPHNGSV